MKNPIGSIESNPIWQVAEVKVSYSNKIKVSELPLIKSSKDSEAILLENWGNNMELLEEFNVLLLNRANRIKESLDSLKMELAEPLWIKKSCGQ